MAIPKFEDFLFPFLTQLKGKDVSSKEMKETLVQHFGLSEEDRMLRTKGGSAYQIDDRIGWARQWLRRALFIEIPTRGVYRITQRGADYLKTHHDLRQEDLMLYPEYASYANGKEKVGKGTTTDIQIKGKEIEELTPTEQLESAYNSINDDLAADLLQKALEASPQFFEQLVLDLLLKMGYGGSNGVMAHNTPFHNYYLDPLHSGLIDFKKQERQIIQTTYTGIFI